MREVEVRLRLVDDTESKPLCTVPLFDVDRVLPLVRSWGVAGEYDLSGQFVIGDTESWYELIVGGE